MLEYTLKRSKRSRSIKISLNQKGAVSVSAPGYVSIKDIESFINKSSDWITQQQKKVVSRESTETETTVMVFGKNYHKKKIYSTTDPIGIFIRATELICNTITPFTTPSWEEREKRQLERFFKNAAENYIIPRTHHWAEKMSTKFNRITLRQQTSRWGSCSSKGNLNFNWRLVHFSPEIIDYVIIHELAHRTHMDHSPRFWNLVAQYDPDHLKHRNTLKKYSVSLD